VPVAELLLDESSLPPVAEQAAKAVNTMKRSQLHLVMRLHR